MREISKINVVSFMQDSWFRNIRLAGKLNKIFLWPRSSYQWTRWTCVSPLSKLHVHYIYKMMNLIGIQSRVQFCYLCIARVELPNYLHLILYLYPRCSFLFQKWKIYVYLYIHKVLICSFSYHVHLTKHEYFVIFIKSSV